LIKVQQLKYYMYNIRESFYFYDDYINNISIALVKKLINKILLKK